MYKRILDHLNGAILLFDRDLTLTYLNSAGEILLADSSRHLVGISAHELFKSSDPALLINLQQCLTMAEPLLDRELILDRMTHSITINFSATPLLKDEQVDEILVELQQVDNHLRISKEERLLTQQNTARLLVRGLAHEIKNPLGGLRGAAQLLDLELDDPELKEYTRIIIAESDRLQGLMDKMLGPNKLPNKKAINIHEVLERVRQLVQAQSNLTVKYDYDPSIPDIYADKDQLIQAILNIVKNAVQALNGVGDIIIKTRIHRQMTIGRKRYKLAVRCDIIDNGPGIDADMMSRIFYPMITGRADGTGLGLSIAQALINQHNGLIECTSEPGSTVFSIFLPIATPGDTMTKPETVWIIDDDKSIRWVVEKALQKANINTRSFSGAVDLLSALQEDSPDALITDIRMPGMDGLELLNKIQLSHPNLPVIVMTAHSDLESAVSAFHGGAFEYLPKPFDIKEVVDLAHRACIHNRQQQIGAALDAPTAEETTPEIIGEAPSMQEVFRAIGRLARSQITVLINGESGTGKELVAKALHRHSPRADKPFIALNMAAIPKDLMESELFGHEKGAFTGAQSRRAGRFEQADGGTLFLDEIGDMPAELQTRLLRVLADGEFYPVGSYSSVKVDVRIIAATHQNLETLVEQGRFREDLFHRLNVIRIHIPPLRERKQDIPLLLRHFLNQAAVELNTEIKILKPEAEAFLSTLDWPGNVRQLENSCRWLTVMASGREIHLHDLPPELLGNLPEKSATGTDWETLLRSWIDQQLLLRSHLAGEGDGEIAKQIIPTVETILIKAALNFTHEKRHEAAILLGYGRNTLTRKIQELGI